MTIDYQLIHVPFAGGLAEHVAPALVPPGKLHTATNAVIRKQGSVEMRPGTDAMTTNILDSASTLDNTRRIFPATTETVTLTETRLLTFSEEADGWRDLDDVYEATIKDRVRGERGRSVAGTVGLTVDAVYVNGYYAVAWVMGGTSTVYFRLIDATTGAKLGLYSWDVDGWRVRLVVIGVRVFAVYQTNGGGSVSAKSFDTTVADSGVEQTVVIGASLDGNVFEACSSSDSLYLVYNYDTGLGIQPRVIKWDAGLSISDDIVTGLEANIFGIAAESGGLIYVASEPTAGGIQCAGIDESTMALQFDTTIYAGADAVFRLGVAIDADNARAVVVWDFQTALANSYTRNRWIDDAGVAGDGGKTWHTGLVSTPMVRGGVPYVVAYYATEHSDTQRFYYLLELKDDTIGETVGAPARVVVRVATWRAGAPGKTFAWVSSLCSVATDEYAFGALMKSETLDNLDEGFDVYRIEFDNREWQGLVASSVQDEPLMAGGVPAAYDGLRCYELGYHYNPCITTAVTAGGGGSMSVGAYSWVAVYEWIDASGVKHQSMPSAPVSHTYVAGSGSASFSVQALSLSERYDDESQNANVGIAIYRTKANGEVYFFEQRIDNVRTDATVACTSTAADATIEVNEKLYTDGGVLDNANPPAMRHIIQHNNRLFGISADDPNFLWVSKINRIAGLMPGWSLQLIIRTDVDGACTALASLDDKLVVFKECAIYVLVGEGPNDQGQSSDMGPPRKVSVSVGCIDPRSVANIPAGVVFRAHDGIYLLGRGLDVQRISDAVEDKLPADYVVTSACQVDRDSLVLFTVDTGGKDDSFVLVYHYAINEWTKWMLPSTAPGGSIVSPSAAVCLRSGEKRWHLLRDDGAAVWLQYADSVDSDDSAQGFRVSSPWLSFAGVQGFERVQFVGLHGTFKSPHSLRVILYYDHDSINKTATTYTLTASEVAESILAVTLGEWTKGANWTGDGGKGPYDHDAGVADDITQAIGVVGDTYEITYTIAGRTSGFLTAYAGTSFGAVRNANGQYTDTITCTVNTTIKFAASVSFDGSVTIDSIRDLSTDVGMPEALQFHVVNQDCRAIRVDVTVMPETVAGSAGDATGVRLESLALEIGGEKGQFRLPQTARF